MAVTAVKTKGSRGRHRPFPAFRVWIGSLIAALIVGLVAMSQVLLHGLQVTALSDRIPWGLWITLDLSAIALGAGAFTFSAAVYLFRIHTMEALARPAVYVGLLGYTSAMLALAMDIGRPDRFWHPLVYWNVHSVLWEITWCVVLYSGVLLMEVLAVAGDSQLGERLPFLRKLGHALHRLTPVLAVIGLGLSLLHQSSLGATYGVLSGRAIWFKPSLPVMFIISAVAGGMSLTLFAALAVAQIRNRRILPDEVCSQADALHRLRYSGISIYQTVGLGGDHLLQQHTGDGRRAGQAERRHSVQYHILGFGNHAGCAAACGPAADATAAPPSGLVMLALGLAAAGVVVNRWNITLSGLVAPPQWSPGVLGNVAAVSYFPSWVEIGVALGIVAYALLGFTLGVRYLGIFSEKEPVPNR